MTLEEEMKIQSEYAREEGFERGIEQGIARGKNEGAAQKEREIAKEMLLGGMAIEAVSKFTKLPFSEIEKLRDL